MVGRGVMGGLASTRKASGRGILAIAAVVGILASLLTSAAPAEASTQLVTYSASDTIPVPPASSYAGSGGGDGWALAFTSSDVYNVFHHSSTLTVACHVQSTAAACWNPETITDTSGDNFATSGQPGLWLDQSTGRLYVYATRTSDSTGGVVCIDTTQAPTNTDPFCGFTALTAVGDAPIVSSISAISAPMQVGSHWYAFNYAQGYGVSGTKNTLLCFDLDVYAPCASQPFTVNLGSGTVSDIDFPSPAVAAIGNQIIIPVSLNSYSVSELACFDASALASCSGTWPASTTTYSYPESANNSTGGGAPFPLLTSSGAISGLCLPVAGDPCFTTAGASTTTPAGLAAAVPASAGWDGSAITMGERVYVPSGNFSGTDQVSCFDYSTGSSCANFPKTFANLSLLYTVNPDPQRANCIWVNSDAGSAQIQNFDAYTGGACQQYPVRILASSIVAPGSTCTPSAYSSLQLVSPTPANYTSGAVTIDDGDGNPLPGLSNLPLDSTGTLSLSGDNLSSPTGLPQFLITLSGAQPSLASAVVKLTWTGTASPSCQPQTTPAVPQSATGGSGWAMRHNPDPCTPRPVNCVSGNFWHTFTDISVPGRGPALTLSRTYNSQNATVAGIFGYGWSSAYDAHLMANGDGSVTITGPDGSQVTATPDGSGGFVVPAWADSALTLTNGVYSYTRQGNLTYAFNSSGKLTSITDRNGYATTLAYNGSGQLATVTDPAGRAITFTFGPNGYVSEVTDPANQVTSYGYDASGNLTTVTDPLSRLSAFGYDTNHLMLTMKDPDSGTTTNVYDSSGRVTSQTDPANLVTTFSYSGNNYSSFGGTTTVTYPHGIVETEQFTKGLLGSITKGTGTGASTWQYTYDTGTYAPSSVIDPNNNVSTFIYDTNGNVTSATDNDGRTSTASYNSFDEPVNATDPAGIATTYSYDSAGNVLTKTVTGVGGSPVEKTSYTYGDGHAGDVTDITDPAGRASDYTYDTYGDIATATTHPASGVNDTTGYTYDVLGRPVCEASPDATAAGVICPAAGQPRVADTTSYVYDADSELASMTDPDANTTSYVYDGDGDRTKVTDGSNNVTATVFDADNRPTSITAGSGTASAATTSYAYDIAPGTGSCSAAVTGATYCTTVTDADQRVTVNYFDNQGRSMEQSQPAAGTTATGYDLAGNLASQTTPAGTSSFGYDAANQLTSVTYTSPAAGYNATANVTYSYDADGQRTKMTDGTGNSTYSYDSLERLQSTTNGANATVGYAYNLDNNLTSITYPNSKSVTYGYDSAGRATTVTDWANNATTYTYDASSNPTGEALPSGDTSTMSYDNSNQVTKISDAPTATPSSPFATMTYARNADQLVASETDTGLPGPASHSYTYDPRNEVTADSATGGYSYDSTGNVTSQPGTASIGYDTAGQLCYAAQSTGTCTTPPSPATTYGYNSAGDRTTQTPPGSTATSFGYDQTNRLVSYSTPSGSGGGGPALAGGEDHSIARKSDGTVWTSGTNNYGELGNGTTTNSTSPVQVSNLTGVTSVAAGGDQSIALKSDGTVYDWGLNNYGQLGNGTTTNASTPVQVSGLTGITQVGEGFYYGIALKSDGTVWSWGYNNYGQLGNGTTTSSSTPVQVKNLTGVIAIAAGYYQNYALKSDGTVWSWGLNNYGQLGNGTTTSSSTPVQVSGLAGITAIAAGYYHGLAVKSDGTIWSWGLNQYGQLGNGTTTSATTPGQVKNVTGATKVAAGAYTSYGLTSGGIDYSWGWNNYGQLGNGTTTNSTTAVQTLTSVSAIGSGRYFGLAVKTDGTTWGWGYNYYGELADGSTTGSKTGQLSPIQTQYLNTQQATTATTASYTYNGDGLRTSKTVNGTTTQETWNTAAPTGTLQLLEDGTTYYVYSPSGLPLEQISSSGTLYYLQDQLGSTRLLTNSSGATTASYSYNDFGQVAATNGSLPAGDTNPFGYTSGYTDQESSLLYLLNRYYDPATGQFLTVDPLVAETGSAYGYVDENPINGADPTGLSKCGQFSLGGLVDCAATAVQHPVGTFMSGWDSMSTDQKWVDGTLPLTLPLTALAVVSGIGDAAGATVFGLSEGGTTAVALGSGGAATIVDGAECHFLHSAAACIGLGLSASSLGFSIAGTVLGGTETLWGGLVASQGLAVSQVGALWDITTSIRDLLRGSSDRSQGTCS